MEGEIEMNKKRWLKENWLSTLVIFTAMMGGICLFGAFHIGTVIIPTSESANVEASMRNLVHAGLTFLIASGAFFLIYWRYEG